MNHNRAVSPPLSPSIPPLCLLLINRDVRAARCGAGELSSRGGCYCC